MLARTGGAALLAAYCLGAAGQTTAAATVAGEGSPRELKVQAGALPTPALPPLAAQPIGDDRLAQLRGGTDTPWSDMKLNGTVGSNAATNVVTGANIITDGAFTNASGLPTVIQNSGANVLIQNATIVNVQFK